MSLAAQTSHALGLLTHEVERGRREDRRHGRRASTRKAGPGEAELPRRAESLRRVKAQADRELAAILAKIDALASDRRRQPRD